MNEVLRVCYIISFGLTLPFPCFILHISNLFEILGPICVCLFLLVAIFSVMCGNCMSMMSLIGTL